MSRHKWGPQRKGKRKCQKCGVLKVENGSHPFFIGLDGKTIWGRPECVKNAEITKKYRENGFEKAYQTMNYDQLIQFLYKIELEQTKT